MDHCKDVSALKSHKPAERPRQAARTKFGSAAAMNARPRGMAHLNPYEAPGLPIRPGVPSAMHTRRYEALEIMLDGCLVIPSN